jgi:hypothetical protein
MEKYQATATLTYGMTNYPATATSLTHDRLNRLPVTSG